MGATLASAARTLKSCGRAKKKRGLPSLILLTDETRLPDPRAAIERLPAGSGVIFRHYDHPRRAGIAKELAALCRRRRLRFMVGGDARLALAVKADGLHLRERDLAGRILPAARRLFITAAAHSRSTLVAARRKGADAALLGPVFATESHKGAPVLGPVRFGLMARTSPLPVYALGGIGPGNARRLVGRGAAGIAGIGGFAPAL